MKQYLPFSRFNGFGFLLNTNQNVFSQSSYRHYNRFFTLSNIINIVWCYNIVNTNGYLNNIEMIGDPQYSGTIPDDLVPLSDIFSWTFSNNHDLYQ